MHQASQTAPLYSRSVHPLRAHRRVLAASMAGTAIEYYDFFIYGTAAALFFGPLFFPDALPAKQALLSLLTFGIAFFARPFGAIAFGHFGDRVGRKATLVGSLLLMGGSTLAIAFLPTYAAAGWIAPALLCLLRFGQGIGMGGEWAGAALLSVENAPQGWRARFGAAPQMGVPLGFFAANAVFLLLGLALSEADLLAWGWRVPFVLSAALVMLGLWVRLKIAETPEFAEALERDPPVAVPIWQLITRYPGAMLAGSAGVIACYAIFYLATNFALAQATGPLGYARETFLLIQLFAILFLAAGTVAAAWHADRGSPARTLSLGALLFVPIGGLFGPGLTSGSLDLATLTLCVTLFCMGFTNAPLGGWLSSLFPVRMRYSGVAFAFNFGGILGGAVTPLIAQMMTNAGMGAQVGLLLTLAAVLSLAGFRLARAAAGTGEVPD